MFTQIGGKPESDFSDPLGLLSDCHQRIRYFLNVLVSVCAQAAEKQLTPDQRTVLEKALWYFREAGPRHTEDEEKSLFPVLRAKNIPRVRRALEKIEKLEVDHRQAEADHDDVDAIGRRWLSDGALSQEDFRQMRILLANLTRLYKRHLVMEEAEIFALADGVLSRNEKDLVGREMAARRGILRR
ncbi:hemerythrin domain-containing protein [Edaphobacter albus]|uniref:hemerythrin domain-containing protein n=1 Tax=Edaphobacter sp. 4G125 TaxID=2763071 RepID=UPI0016471263|nr:hemerythrin domain-containing protein [Edaphobacter sp. 4G125]QNI37662.1 hemerythrin domain-containing protein [Edaphobacter sp. 4G125]